MFAHVRWRRCAVFLALAVTASVVTAASWDYSEPAAANPHLHHPSTLTR